jgi:hypothetical protein
MVQGENMKSSERIFFVFASIFCCVFFGLWQNSAQAGMFMYILLGIIVNLVDSVIEKMK